MWGPGVRLGVGNTVPAVANTGQGEAAMGAGRVVGWGPAAGTMVGVQGGEWQVQGW